VSSAYADKGFEQASRSGRT